MAPLGVESVALLDIGGSHIHALLGARTALGEGDDARASIRPDAALFSMRGATGSMFAPPSGLGKLAP